MKKLAAQNGIISLVVVLGVGLFALVAALGVASVVLAELRKGLNTDSGNRVFQSGESAMTEGSYRYLNSASYSGAMSPINNASAQTVSTDDSVCCGGHWPEVYIMGVANNTLSNRVVKQTLNIFPEGRVFDYAVYSMTQLTLGGTSNVIGNTFSNGIININSSGASVTGDASTNQTITGFSNNITGIKNEGATKIPGPTLDSAPYKAEAITNATYYTSAATLQSFLNGQTRTGVIFCDGCAEVQITNPATNLDGSLVTRSNLKISDGTFTASNQYAAIFVGGNLTMTGGTINGIVYVRGSASLSGNAKINGLLLNGSTHGPFVPGAGITNLSGNTSVQYVPSSFDWRTLFGLFTFTPEKIILDWKEE